MKKRVMILGIMFLPALVFIGAAFFADALGLDKNPDGWGRARISMLILGAFLLLCAGVYYRYAGQIELPFLRYVTQLEVHKSTAGLPRFIRSYGFTFPIMILVILIYAYFVSSGTWMNWVSPTRYYADLARGFERGKLFIPGEPTPKLSELPNPYDPIARAEAGVKAPIDITYYNGRYYLYWGPVPALILLALQPITYGRVGDLQLAFGFICGIFLAQSFIILFIWERFFHNHPKWMLALSIALAGGAGPVLFMLNNFKGARIYEASVAGGQFFFASGLFFILVMLAGELPSNWKLFLAGTLFALSVGTRLSLVIPVGVVTAMASIWILRSKTGTIQKLSSLFAFALPLLLGAAGLGWYNWERFGSITETGLYYQLAGLNIQKNYPNLSSPIYICQNLYNYFLNPFRLEVQFPFTYVEYGNTQPIFPSYNLPALYNSQQITGLLYIAPFVIFSAIPILNFPFVRSNKAVEKPLAGRDDDLAYRWIVLVLGASFLSAFAFLVSFFWSAMRYMEDFLPSLTILSVIGFLQGYQMFTGKTTLRKYHVILGIALAAISITLSGLAGISINDLRFAFTQ